MSVQVRDESNGKGEAHDNVIHVRFGPGGGRRVDDLDENDLDEDDLDPTDFDGPIDGAEEQRHGAVSEFDVSEAISDDEAVSQAEPFELHPASGSLGSDSAGFDSAGSNSAGSVPSAETLSDPDSASAHLGSDAPRRTREPYGDLFRRNEVARLFSVPEGRLRYWDRAGFIQPSAKVGRRRLYTFQDLIGIRAALDLLRGGASLPTVRRSLEGLQGILPQVTRPLNELRVVTEGATVVVRDRDYAFEAETGQLQLNFTVRAIRDAVVRDLRPGAVGESRRREAYRQYLEGCRLDEDEATLDSAEGAYARAVELDANLANAWTNWGNLRFRCGDVKRAEELYRRALEVDTEQPEAYYNLGFLSFERGELALAAALFERAVHFDPGFADAHFNLAMVYEELGRQAEARPFWENYLELDPDGTWAEIARRHLR